MRLTLLHQHPFLQVEVQQTWNVWQAHRASVLQDEMLCRWCHWRTCSTNKGDLKLAQVKCKTSLEIDYANNFLNDPSPASFSFIFWSFFKKILEFLQQITYQKDPFSKYFAEIWTHDLPNLGLLLWPIDQGSRLTILLLTGRLNLFPM